MQLIWGYTALVLNIIAYLPYIHDILRKKAKPHPYTWAIWTILTMIVAFNQVANGGGYSNLFLVSTAILVGTVFLLSLHFGMGGASKVDRICLLLASILLVYWLLSKETHISTIFAVIIDIIGAIPTIIKTYHHPKSETYTIWILASIGGVIKCIIDPALGLGFDSISTVCFYYEQLNCNGKIFSRNETANAFKFALAIVACLLYS